MLNTCAALGVGAQSSSDPMQVTQSKKVPLYESYEAIDHTTFDDDDYEGVVAVECETVQDR